MRLDVEQSTLGLYGRHHEAENQSSGPSRQPVNVAENKEDYHSAKRTALAEEMAMSAVDQRRKR